MLRLRSNPSGIYKRLLQRFYTTSSRFSEQLSKLRDTPSPSHSDYKSILIHPEISQNINQVSAIFESISQNTTINKNERSELHNTVLRDLLKYDGSLVSSHIRALDQIGASMDVNALQQVIEFNKGRVDSSWEIFEKWIAKNGDVTKGELQPVLKSLLQKVVYGDPSDQEEGFTLSKDGLIRATWIIKNLEEVEKDLKDHVMLEALRESQLPLVCILVVETLEEIAKLNPTDEKLIVIWSSLGGKILETGVQASDIPVLERLLVLLAKNTPVSDELWAPTTIKKLQKLNQALPSLSIDIQSQPDIDTRALFINLVKSLGQYINSENNAFVALRQTLLRCYGIYQNDFKEASRLYSEFIVDDKTNVDFYMTTMTQISCYLAAKEKNMIYLQLAESMIPPEHTPVSSLRARILAYSAFDTDKSLDVYNDWISKLSRKNNDEGFSQGGLLTESLMLAFLSKGEREFAYVIRDGALEHGIISGEVAEGRVKAILKRYGEVLGEEEQTGSENLMEKEVLLAIERL
ncbi:CYFA0S19e01486g1_1 [Cyberlindnera fabianii]|uniref:CYFA0S19e01486g1_1 n=1 Tax=Cyberlindnera fabianii TaxID=36022 RepID=A0A061B8G7_CYBFA|nr:CYFA0S19e01486g1_1 [Cyberlindnera fabianii]